MDLNGFRIVDLTKPLDPSAETRRCHLFRFNTGGPIPDFHTIMDLTSHLGTHVECPYHHRDEWSDVASLPITAFAGRAVYVNIDCLPPNAYILPAILEKVCGKVREGDIVILDSNYRIPPFISLTNTPQDRRLLVCRETAEWLAQGQKGQVRGLRPGRLHRELPGGRLRLPRRAYGGGRGLSGGPLQPGAAVHRCLFPLLRPAAHQGPGFLPRAGLRHRGPCGILLTSPDCPCCRTFPAAGAIFMTAGELPQSRPHPEQLRALKSAAIPPDDPFKRCKIPASHRSDPLTTIGISDIISYDV